MNLRDALEEMLNEMECHYLEVILAPQKRRTNEGGCIRVVVSRNVPWYQKLCAAYPKNRTKPRRRRKPDTAIKRGHVMRALRLLSGLSRGTAEEIAAVLAPGTYAMRLLDIARDRLRNPEKWTKKSRMIRDAWNATVVESFDAEKPF